MRTFLQLFLMAVLAVCAGCQTPWALGSVEECLPRHAEKCRADAAFFVAKTEKRVKARLEEALRARGFAVVETARESDYMIKTTVDSWEYNDAGFTGFWERDDMRLTVSLVDRRTNRVLGRWRIVLKSDFRILDRCVDKM